MSFMKLQPEAVRLRRIAKAHAAGEFSLLDYREARREVIANFSVSQFHDDDTQPRFDPASNHDATGVGVEMTGPGNVNGSLATHWSFGKVMMLLAVLASAALIAGQVLARSIQIPALKERDPNPVTSTRLEVQGVAASEIGGLDLLDAIVVQETIDDTVDSIRLQNEPGSHGFTNSELEELGRFLNALGAHQPSTELSARDAADLSALIQQQKIRRGLSVVELESVAGAVQRLYRGNGYFLAVAYVPAQTVLEGQVRIDVLPGVLGEVNVEGGSQKLANRFSDLIGRPLTREVVSSRLYVLNETAGVSARIHFEPSRKVGQTRLNLEVLEDKGWMGSVAADNYGDDHTGRQRFLGSARWGNPTGRGDVLQLGAIASLDPANQLYGYVEYLTPLTGAYQLSGRVSNNDFDVDSASAGQLDGVGLRGEGLLADLTIGRALFRTRRSSLSYQLGVGLHNLDWSYSQPDEFELEQNVRLVSAIFKGHRVWDASQIAVDGKIFADVGRIGGDTFAGQDDRFWDMGFETFAWRPFDLPMLPGRQKVSMRIVGQLSSSHLPSTRRFALGGVNAARGFQRDVFVADQGVLMNLDVRTSLPVGEIALFTDLAYGKKHNELFSPTGRLANIGISWDAQLPGKLASRLSWAVPVLTDGVKDDGSQIFWSLQYAP